MNSETITLTLSQLFPPTTIQHNPPDAWQVDLPDCRLLVLLSADLSWLRILLPIAPLSEAQLYLEQLLSANFDQTQEVRYALSEGVLWGVYQHQGASLTQEDFKSAIARLIDLHTRGLDDYFNDLVEQRLRQIIQAAKLQGHTLEKTMQTLERFYQEGMLGGLQQTSSERETVLIAWNRRLEGLWAEVELPEYDET